MSRFAMVFRTGTRSWPVPELRCTTAIWSRQHSPKKSIKRRFGNGAQRLRLVNPKSAALDRAIDHPFVARLDELPQAAGHPAAERRHTYRIGGRHPVWRRALRIGI